MSVLRLLSYKAFYQTKHGFILEKNHEVYIIRVWQKRKRSLRLRRDIYSDCHVTETEPGAHLTLNIRTLSFVSLFLSVQCKCKNNNSFNYSLLLVLLHTSSNKTIFTHFYKVTVCKFTKCREKNV